MINSPAKDAVRLRAKAMGFGVSRLTREHADDMIPGVKKEPNHSVEATEQGKPVCLPSGRWTVRNTVG